MYKYQNIPIVGSLLKLKNKIKVVKEVYQHFHPIISQNHLQPVNQSF